MCYFPAKVTVKCMGQNVNPDITIFDITIFRYNDHENPADRKQNIPRYNDIYINRQSQLEQKLEFNTVIEYL